MGWFDESHPGHEGYLVGFVQVGGLWRELGYVAGDDKPIKPIARIAVGCDCGWRSTHLQAPYGTAWHPYSVGPDYEHERFRNSGMALKLWEEEIERCAIAIWRRHVEDLRGLRIYADGAALLRELARISKGEERDHV